MYVVKEKRRIAMLGPNGELFSHIIYSDKELGHEVSLFVDLRFYNSWPSEIKDLRAFIQARRANGEQVSIEFWREWKQKR